MAISVPVKDLNGKQIAKLGLNEAVFGVDMNEAVVYQALVRQRANERQGTASSKTRGEVSGTTRKPWRQKHTGRARVGTRMSPLWRHGGTIFGPKPRTYTQKLPKKMRRLAIRCLLSGKHRGSELSVIKELKLEGKTKEVAALFDALDITSAGVLIVTKEPDSALMRGARNFDRVKTIPAAQISVGDLLKYRFLVMTVDAVRATEQIWARQKINRKRVPSSHVEEEVIPVAIEEAIEPEPEAAAGPVVTTKRPAGRTRKKTAPASIAVEDKSEVEEAPDPKRRRVVTKGTRSRSARSRSEPKASAVESAVTEKPEVEEASKTRRRRTATTGSPRQPARSKSDLKTSGVKTPTQKKPATRRPRRNTTEKDGPSV